MIVRLKDQLSRMKRDSEMRKDGTLAVIDGVLDFHKTDGYIQFMKIALDRIDGAYGEQDPKWKECVSKIYAAAEKLQDSVTWYDDSKESFDAYCDRLSCVMESDVEPLSVPKLDIVTSDDLTKFIKKHIEKGNYIGFYYMPMENTNIKLMHDLMDQLNNMKLEKSRCRDIYTVSYYLLSVGYHEHVVDALNTLLNSAVYAINCSSTREQTAYSFDTQRLHNDLRQVEFMMERVKMVK